MMTLAIIFQYRLTDSYSSMYAEVDPWTDSGAWLERFGGCPDMRLYHSPSLNIPGTQKNNKGFREIFGIAPLPRHDKEGVYKSEICSEKEV